MAAVDSQAERFNGFSDEAIQFLLDLQAEQNREWFKAHQSDYVRLLRRPLELFVAELCERLSDVYPSITGAEPHFFRIQRDTRFSRDKAPYKTNVAADVPIRPLSGQDEEHAVPGIYVSFGLEGEYVGAGAWHMSPEVLTRFRQALDDERTGARIKALVDQLVARGYGIEAMERLKRVPPPYAPDHPRADLLKYKGLAIGVQPEANVTSSPAFVDWAADKLRAVAPLMHLVDSVLAGRGNDRV